VVHNPKMLFLSQSKYIQELLDHFEFSKHKLICTPLPFCTTLSLMARELLYDPTNYRSMVGAVQYVTMTKPNIAYVVHLVFQFMHAPPITHLLVVERIFRYLHDTKFMDWFSKSWLTLKLAWLTLMLIRLVALIILGLQLVTLSSWILILFPCIPRNNL